MKKEKGIKAENVNKPKPEPSVPAVAKRARPISAEISTAKRSNATTRQQAKVLEEAASAEEAEGNELPTLAELLESAEGTGEYAGEDPARIRRR